MSIFEDLTQEIYDWLDDDQDPESIKKDIMATVDEAIAARKKNKYVVAIAEALQGFAEENYEDLAKDNFDGDAYVEMAQDILKNMREAFKELEFAVEFNKRTAVMLDKLGKILGENKTDEDQKTDTQKDEDADTIAKFLKGIEAERPVRKPVRRGTIKIAGSDSNKFDF